MCPIYNLNGDGDPRRGFISAGNRDGKEMLPQAFVGIHAGKFFYRGDGDEELKPDGEFHVAIPALDATPECFCKLADTNLIFVGRSAVLWSIYGELGMISETTEFWLIPADVILLCCVWLDSWSLRPRFVISLRSSIVLVADLGFFRGRSCLFRGLKSE